MAVQNQQGYNNLVNLGYSAKDATSEADASTPNPNFNPVYQAGNVPSNFSGTYRSAETGQDITLNGGQPSSAGASVDTSQPSPKPTSITPSVGSNTQSTPNVGFDQALKGLQSGGLKGNDLANATQDLKSKYNIGLSNAQAGGTQAPQSVGDGSAGAQANLPPPTPAPYDSTKADSVLADNQAHQQYLNDFAQSQSSTAQTESLTQTYSEITNQLGIPALDTQLMNMKNVIDGTEQDIRDEVTKAGGFATNSQVLAMTDSRNKVMIQNYNNLLQTKQDAEQNLSTMMDLTEKDREYAQQKISSQLQFDQQNIQYADKALSNAQDAFKTMQSSEGWDGIYKAALATGDPQAIQKINSTMGPGFDLASMAQQDAATRATAAQKSNLELQQAGLNLTSTKANITNTYANTEKTQAEAAAAAEKAKEDAGVPIPAKANQPGFTSIGVKLTPATAEQQVVSQWKSSNSFDKNGIIPPGNYKQAKAWWTEQGLSNTSFDDVFGQYIDTGSSDKYK